MWKYATFVVLFLGICENYVVNCLSPVAVGSTFASSYSELLKSLNGVSPLVPSLIEPRFKSASGLLGKKVPIRFCSDAFTSTKLQYARMVSFCGQGYDVFNFLAIPSPLCNMPMFGADIVVLPGGVIAAIDFQPLSALATHTTTAPYRSNTQMFHKWQTAFPSGGELPPAAKRFFSPYALWTRLGSSYTSDELSSLKLALLEYCQAYCTALKAAPLDASSSDSDRELFLSEYLDYRIANDPAKNMLVGAFGADWTETVLSDVLFPNTKKANA